MKHRRILAAILLGVILCATGVVAWTWGDDVPVAKVGPETTRFENTVVETTLERLVIVDPSTKQASIVLRTIDGQPVIILLRPGETEEKAVLDFRSGNATGPKSIVGEK